jgi:nucleotide-binding universal stress UspA family protein
MVDDFKRILVATDGSDGATQALRKAIALAASMRAALTVLTIFEPVEPEEIAPLHKPGPREFARVEHLQGAYAEAKEIISESILAEAKSIVSKFPRVNASFVFLQGDPATQILWYADEIEADLIVMGRRGRGRLVGLLLGSVSQAVTGAARQFVLLAPIGK